MSNCLLSLTPNSKVETFFMPFKISPKQPFLHLISSYRMIPTPEVTINGFTSQFKKYSKFQMINKSLSNKKGKILKQ